MSDRGLTLRDGWHTAFKFTFGILTAAIAVLMFIDPFNEKHFLRSFPELPMIRALALGGAGILTASALLPLCVSFVRARSHPEFRHSFPALFPERNGCRIVANDTVIKFLIILLSLGGIVGVSAYFGMRIYLPMILHDLGRIEQANIPFVIRSASFSKYCSGVTGDNPDFLSRRLCGVKLKGALDEYYGKSVVLIGWRSPYGFRVERYVLPEIERTTE